MISIYDLLTFFFTLNRGVATHMLKCKCVHIWTKIMARFYHDSDGFLMLCVQNLCIDPVFTSKSNFDRIVMMLVSPPDICIAPFDDLSLIKRKSE